jgi:hypothetical protein
MGDDEITESAKAVQEVAKATGKALDVSEKVGSFVAKVIGEPLESAVGMLSDRLRFMRWERQIRMVDRCEEIMRKRRIEGKTRAVPPKLALPIIENASLEENNQLQDLWANLLSSALDPNFKGTLRSAFIDIIKQLEIVDAHILSFLYRSYLNSIKMKEISEDESPSVIGWGCDEITTALKMSNSVYENSVDNLMRVRCVKPLVLKVTGIRAGNEPMTIDKGYDVICLTSLGKSFVEACMILPD